MVPKRLLQTVKVLPDFLFTGKMLLTNGSVGSYRYLLSDCDVAAIRTVLLLILYRKKLAINIKQFVKRCYLKMGIPMIIVVVLGMGINHLLPEAGWGMLLLKAFFIGMIYLGIVGAMNYKDAKKLIEKLK